MKAVFVGAHIYLRGFKIAFRDKKLVSLQIIPWIINLVLFGFGLAFMSKILGRWLEGFMHHPQVWYQWVGYYLLLAIGFLGGLAMLFALMSVLLNLIQFPFNDALVRRTLSHHSSLVAAGAEGGLRGWLKNMGVLVRRTVLFLVIGGGIFIGGFIPGLGIFVLILSFLLMAYDSMDYVFDVFHWSLRERLRFVGRHRGRFLGFSLMLGVSRLIPVLNMFFLPVGVIASAVFVAQALEQGP